jgi:alkanesulfonate monooxygenase SsuD/methylene tetrahydromethanopterin reductase-like flavin-dependent oxidoreductase (luciferase family)
MEPTEPILDPVIALTFAAAVTTTLRLGTGVIILPPRNPLVLAKELASLDVLSCGRLVFGIGVGYLEPQFCALGIELKDHGPRGDEYLAVMRSIRSAEHPAYEGRFFRFGGVNAFPRPVQQPTPSLVIGGHSTAATAARSSRLTAGTASACRQIRRRLRWRRFAQLASAGCGRPSLVLSKSASLHHAATRIANSRDVRRTWVSIA